MDWTKVVTDPLGIAGFAIALVFGAVSRVLAKKNGRSAAWLVPGAYALALICVLGGIVLAYQRQKSVDAAQYHPFQPPTSNATAPSMRIGTIGQKVENGSAVAGVQGSVIVNAPAKKEDPATFHP